jgi:hypothetical protein
MSEDQRNVPGLVKDPERQGSAAARPEVEQNGRIECPVCGFPIGAVRGSKAAICGNCGFKDGCC